MKKVFNIIISFFIILIIPLMFYKVEAGYEDKIAELVEKGSDVTASEIESALTKGDIKIGTIIKGSGIKVDDGSGDITVNNIDEETANNIVTLFLNIKDNKDLLNENITISTNSMDAHKSIYEIGRQYLDGINDKYNIEGAEELEDLYKEGANSKDQTGGNNTGNDMNDEEINSENEKKQNLENIKETTTIYKDPKQNTTNMSVASNLDDVVSDADAFVDSANNSNKIAGTIEEKNLQDFSSVFYNILLYIGTGTVVLIGAILGVKFILSGAEGRADIKQMLVPYVVGSVVIFGSFIIWKIIVEMLSRI